MTAKRWDGAAYVDLTVAKRWDGAAWVNLTIAKRWDGAAWQDIPGVVGGSGFSAVANKSVCVGSVFDPTPAPLFATVTSDSVTVTASGGTGPYTYAWTRVSGDSAISATAASAATTAFTATVPRDGERVGVWRCTVTDSLAATASVDVGVELYYTTDA
jgi:hypothetical protein